MQATFIVLYFSNERLNFALSMSRKLKASHVFTQQCPKLPLKYPTATF